MKKFLALLLVLGLFLPVAGCGKDAASAPRSASSNKVLNLVTKARNYVIADLQALNHSGLIDLVKKNLQPSQKAELDKVTAEMGIDPFTAMSTIAIWGGEKFFEAEKYPDQMNIAVVTDLEAGAVDKVFAYLESKAKGEKEKKEQVPNIAILGKINKASVVELSKKSSPNLKEFPAEDGIALFQDDRAVMGVIDGEAVLASKTRDGVKTLWKSLQDASSGENTSMTSGEILKVVLNPMQDDVVSVIASVTSRDGGLDIRCRISALNPQKAQGIGGSIQMMTGFFTSSPKMDQKVKDAVKNLKVDYSGNDVTLSLTIPADVLK